MTHAFVKRCRRADKRGRRAKELRDIARAVESDFAEMRDDRYYDVGFCMELESDMGDSSHDRWSDDYNRMRMPKHVYGYQRPPGRATQLEHRRARNYLDYVPYRPEDHSWVAYSSGRPSVVVVDHRAVPTTLGVLLRQGLERYHSSGASSPH